MIIAQTLLDNLTTQAKASSSLRMNLDLPDSPEDQSLRMLNVNEPETVLPTYRHRTISETVVCFRGHFEECFFDEGRRLTETNDMVPDRLFFIFPAGQWHSLKYLESGTMLLECKDGTWESLGEEDILKIEK